MDVCQLVAITEKQEQIITELEQELCDLLSEQEKVAGAWKYGQKWVKKLG